MSYNPCHMNEPQLGQRQVLGLEGVLLRPRKRDQGAGSLPGHQGFILKTAGKARPRHN